MNETAFRDTLEETLKYDPDFLPMAATLLPIVGRCSVSFLPQWEFTRRRSDQRWENVEIRVPVPLIECAKKNEDDLSNLVSYVYQETEDYAFGSLQIRPQIIKTEWDELPQNDVVFDHIRDTVIQGIRDAKYVIWVAVAWFTENKFYEELLEKKKEGLNIRVIVSNETNNASMIQKLKKEFDTVVIPQWGFHNRMHDKFCIIDMDYVMHGSYNWTPTAEHNGENWATSTDRTLVKKFADEFMKWYVNKAQ